MTDFLPFYMSRITNRTSALVLCEFVYMFRGTGRNNASCRMPYSAELFWVKLEVIEEANNNWNYYCSHWKLKFIFNGEADIYAL